MNNLKNLPYLGIFNSSCPSQTAALYIKGLPRRVLSVIEGDRRTLRLEGHESDQRVIKFGWLKESEWMVNELDWREGVQTRLEGNEREGGSLSVLEGKRRDQNEILSDPNDTNEYSQCIWDTRGANKVRTKHSWLEWIRRATE